MGSKKEQSKQGGRLHKAVPTCPKLPSLRSLTFWQVGTQQTEALFFRGHKRGFRFKCSKALLDSGVVNAQELVLGSGHVDKIRFTLGTLFVEKLVYRLVGRHFLQVSANNLVKRLVQVWRATLGGGIALGILLARLVYSGVNSGKAMSEPRLANRYTSPISAMSCAPVISPTP